MAIIDGHLELVKLLIDHGANPNTRTSRGEDSLMLAAKESQLPILKYLLVGGESVSSQDHYGQTALHHAGGSSAEAFSYLLLKGADLYAQDYYGDSPIDTVLDSNDAPRALWSLIFNWNMDFERCIKPLSSRVFASDSQASLLRNLLKRLPKSIVRREIDAFSNRRLKIDATLLTEAAMDGQIKIMDLLIRAGANIDLDGGPNGTPLTSACMHGRLGAVIYLVRAGANLFCSRNCKTLTAVKAAEGFPEIIQWLLAERYMDQIKLA